MFYIKVWKLKHYMFSHKVEIGLRKGEKKMVGYINCTHLHAPEGKCYDAFTEIVYLGKLQFCLFIHLRVISKPRIYPVQG